MSYPILRREAPEGDRSSAGSTARALLGANASLRVAYGLGATLVPDRMEAMRLAPSLADRPDARLFVRGFGAHLILVGVLGLVAVRRRRGESLAIKAAVAIDLADVGVALLEARRRGKLDQDLSGGLLISGLGALTAVLAGARRFRGCRPPV
jgi:hypothetical protein